MARKKTLPLLIVRVDAAGAAMHDVVLQTEDPDLLNWAKITLDDALLREENLDWLLGIWGWHGCARSFSGLRTDAAKLLGRWASELSGLCIVERHGF